MAHCRESSGFMAAKPRLPQGPLKTPRRGCPPFAEAGRLRTAPAKSAVLFFIERDGPPSFRRMPESRADVCEYARCFMSSHRQEYGREEIQRQNHWIPGNPSLLGRH